MTARNNDHEIAFGSSWMGQRYSAQGHKGAGGRAIMSKWRIRWILLRMHLAVRWHGTGAPLVGHVRARDFRAERASVPDGFSAT
jgi:hypothetical protein